MKPFAVVVATFLLGSVLAGCGDDAKADCVSVVASSYPFAFVAERVGGEQVSVDNLTSPGVEPHDVELKPKQVAAVQTADLVVYERGFQHAIDDAVEQSGRPAGDVVDAAAVGTIRDGDPHVWLDPRTMVTLAQWVAERLSDEDPAHARDYEANARRFTDEVEQLDADLAAGLRTCRLRTIVTSHAAFGYLTERYDLMQVPIAGIEPTQEPSPSQLADISALVKREGITTIFTEELVSPAIADTIARETGARTATLDPIEGLGRDTSDETYLTLMRRNLDAIRSANGCS